MRIPVRRGGLVIAHALVSSADFARLNQYRWHFDASGYARRGVSAGGRRTVLMHRDVLRLAPDDPREVDHINRDTLDNRRVNLRACTRQENKQNLADSGYTGSTSRFRGVSWDTRRAAWVASIKLNGKRKHLGQFDSEEEAAEIAARARREHYPFSAEAA